MHFKTSCYILSHPFQLSSVCHKQSANQKTDFFEIKSVFSEHYLTPKLRFSTVILLYMYIWTKNCIYDQLNISEQVTREIFIDRNGWEMEMEKKL